MVDRQTAAVTSAPAQADVRRTLQGKALTYSQPGREWLV